MSGAKRDRSVRAAARASGIATSYRNYKNDLIQIDDSVLKKFVSIVGTTDFKNMRQDKIEKALPETIVYWDGVFPVTWVWCETIPDSIRLDFSGAETISQEIRIEPESCIPRKVDGKNLFRVRLSGDFKLSFDYYDLKLFADGKIIGTSFVISAPRKIKSQEKSWGVFAPAYALRQGKGQGIGGYTELKQAAQYIHGKGGSFIGTLPLLPPAHENDAHSPYSPVSRFFWDELFLDLNDLPGKTDIDLSELAAFESAHYIDYKKIYALKKTILEKAARDFFKKNPQGDEGFKKFVKHAAYLEDYADFNARDWDDPDAGRGYYLYTQYACHLQLSSLRGLIDQGRAAKLYFDYPVGVDPAGFDAVKMPDLFLQGFTIGAPPDMLAVKGQNWGLLPLDPQKMASTKFEYFRTSLRHYFCYSHLLRLDHVMGLYRLFCIPNGQDGLQGTYIYYPFKALLAVLCLEAYRHDAVVIGENLGTVPEAVDKAMEAHNIYRMWILQFNMQKNIDDSFRSIEPDMLAGLNTHDLSPFEAYLGNKDIADLKRHGMIDKAKADMMSKERKAVLSEWKKEDEPLYTALTKLAASPADMVIVGMEDLWKEILPQNIPGTMSDHNWSRKFSLATEDWEKQDTILNSFEILNQNRTSAA